MMRIILLMFTLSFCLNSRAQQDSIYKDVTLDSITVKGHRPMVKTEGSHTTVSVKGTYLSHIGNLENMLSLTPGIISKGKGVFEVVGKGAPKVYIDGREVTQMSILGSLKSDNIARIEIEKEPSSEYPAGTNAVVNIITIKPVKDFISLDLGNTATLRRRFSENPSADFRIKSGKWTSGLSYDYALSNNLNKETYFVEIYSPEATASRFQSDTQNRELYRSQSHSIVWSNDFDFGKSYRLSFIYYFDHSSVNDHSGERETYNENGIITDKGIDIYGQPIRNLHNFTLFYSGKTGRHSSITLSGDYSLIHNNNYSRTTEENGDVVSDIFTSIKNRYKVLTLYGWYNFVLPYQIGAVAGARYYNVDNPTNYLTDNPRVETKNSSNTLKAKDNVTAAFITLSKIWRRFTLALGARYEYSDTRLEAEQNDISSEAHRHTSDFLPTATAKYTPCKLWTFQAGYKRSVTRQGYQGLNPYVTYKDSLSYASGNSSLRPSYTERLYLYATWKDVTLSMNYYNVKNKIGNVMYCPDLSSNAVMSAPVNFSRFKSLDATLSNSKYVGKMMVATSLSCVFPHYDYEFLNREMKVRKVYWIANINLSYRMSDKFTAFTRVDYQSRYKTYNMLQYSACNWTMGMQASLLDDRLSAVLSITDITHDANYNNVKEWNVNTINGTYGTNDMRGVSLTLSYTLFNDNISIKGKRINQDVLKRTESD